MERAEIWVYTIIDSLIPLEFQQSDMIYCIKSDTKYDI